MTKKDHDESRGAAARQRAEIATHERLRSMRGELGEMCDLLDRLTLTRPRMRAGTAGLGGLSNLLAFGRRRTRRI